MFGTNYIKYFNEHIRSSIFSLLCRLHQSENPLFVNYFHTNIHFRSSINVHILEISIVHIILYFIIFFTLFFIIILITYSIILHDLFSFYYPLIYYLTCTL